jgi:hypothetical protein
MSVGCLSCFGIFTGRAIYAKASVGHLLLGDLGILAITVAFSALLALLLPKQFIR